MRFIRGLALTGVAAFLVCAAVASSASALEAYDQSTGTALAVGTAVTGTTTGNSTLSGTFFGFAVTMACTGSSFSATVDNNGAVVSGSITSFTWSGCSSAFKNPCNYVAQGLPWGMANGGGFEALSTTAVDVAMGSGAIDMSDCMTFGATCTLTGAVASAGSTPLSNAVPFTWNNAAGELSVSGTGKIKAKSCAASGVVWNATYALTVASNGDKVGLR